MRKRRPWRVITGTAGVAMLFAMSGSAVSLSAAPPSPDASASASVSADPNPSASPTASPKPSPEFDCALATAAIEGNGSSHILRGATVRVRFEAFAPMTTVTLLFSEWTDPGRQIGSGTADGHGDGVIEGVLPIDARIGQALLIVSDDRCRADLYILVLGSRDVVTIDDDTVRPGQRVTVTAGGFQPNSLVLLSIDRAPTQGECGPQPCRYLGTGEASSDGTAVIRARIPRDTAAGAHRLWLTGLAPDDIFEFSIGVDITVFPAGPLPATDMAPAG
jgi:hypothetical protein